MSRAVTQISFCCCIVDDAIVVDAVVAALFNSEHEVIAGFQRGKKQAVATILHLCVCP